MGSRSTRVWSQQPGVVFQDDSHRRYHRLGNFRLENGLILPDARIAYAMFGQLNAARDNAVLLPSWYRADHHGYDFLIWPGRALDPEKYFIVASEMFANGFHSGHDWPRHCGNRSGVAEILRSSRQLALPVNRKGRPLTRVNLTNAASCCPPLSRLRRNSRRTDVPVMRIGIVRLHQPLDSRARATDTSATGNHVSNCGHLSRIACPGSSPVR